MSSTSARPDVPEDAPPAVLFRLSYRTNEKYRSGFRDCDSPRDIVQSMRGWWELDPREVERLGIEHAVAFHQGVTRAVVEIDRWKWLEVKDDDHHRKRVDDLGHDFDSCAWPAKQGIRWAFDVKSDRADDDVWDAWVGLDGKRVPDRLYHTITSYWPASTVDSPHDLLGKALKLLGEGLQPTIESVFAEADDDWLERLRRKHRILTSYRGDVSPQDPYIALNLLISEWETVSPLFSWTDRDFVETLVDDRNRWAHFDEETNAEIVLEAVGDIITLLKGVGAKAEATRADSIRRALELQVDPLEVLEGA